MTGVKHHSGAVTAMLAVALLCMLAVQVAQAQTLTVLHSFSGQMDGATPLAGLTVDRNGSLYGTTNKGGAGYGTVFKLASTQSGWLLSPLYSFQAGADGANPVARVVFGPDGSLYGTTELGGSSGYCTGGCGTVFNLKPQFTACKSALCPWQETILRRFTTGGDLPQSEVVFNGANLYGTAYYGGALAPGGGGSCNPCGNVYELSPSNGSWIETVLFSFTGYSYGDDGAYPVGGVSFDSQGRILGTNTSYGNCGFGTLFELTLHGSSWSETLLHDFCGGADGALPVASMIEDSAGNYYGTTKGALPGYGTQSGSVFTLKPNGSGGWAYASLHSFPGYGSGPAGSLVMDGAGNLYGTTTGGGLTNCQPVGCGTIFQLSPAGNGQWTATTLYQFTGGSDGGQPFSNLILDSNGNLYGTTSTGGADGYGAIFKFTR